jgi:hypothetical protein
LIFCLLGSIVGDSARTPQASRERIGRREKRLTVAALFNDRSTFAWVIVLLYFGAAGASLWARSVAESRERHFWLATALLLILLGLNKELDLQTLLTVEARSFAKSAGLYEQRRLMQALFLLMLTGFGAIALVILIGWLRGSSRWVKTAAVGIVLLFTFVVVRAGSFHHIDQWVTIDVAGLRSGWLLELAGILVIGVSAIAFGQRKRAEIGPSEPVRKQSS